MEIQNVDAFLGEIKRFLTKMPLARAFSARYLHHVTTEHGLKPVYEIVITTQHPEDTVREQTLTYRVTLLR